MPHIPCTIGQVLPVNEICAWSKANGIISAIDGAHPLGMLQMNLKEMGCDYYSGCFHKWLLGPIGTGFFYASEEILSRSAIHHVAAYSVDKFDMSTTPPSMGELVNKTARYSYGTFPGPMYDGAKAAMQFYQKIGPALIEKRVKYLSKEVMNGLMEINDNPTLKFPVIEVLTPSEDASRGAQVGFRIHEHPSKIAAANIQTTKAESPISNSAVIQTLVPGTSTKEAIDLSIYAKDIGADASLSVVPYYNKPTQEGLYRHFRTLAETVDIPQILYNVPSRTITDIENDTVLRLTEIPNIIGIKDATGDMGRAADLLRRVPQNFIIYSGDDSSSLALLLLGGHGVISVTANVAPKLMHEMCVAAFAGDLITARAINYKLLGLH